MFMSRLDKLGKKAKSGRGLLKREGLLALTILSLQKLEKRRQKASARKKFKIRFLADYDDIMKADLAKKDEKTAIKKAKLPLTVNWVMSPPRSGGGHQNIFRFI
jgi:hypothetical protein